MRELLWWMRARSAMNSGAAAFAPMPLLDSVTPATGPQAGGTTITLRGNLLDSATRVLVGGVDCANVVRQGSRQCQASTPAGSAGVVDVSVITLGGQSTKAGAFTYASSAPTVSAVVNAISTSVGDIAGGFPVTITGTDFTGATGVTFGGTAATSVVVVGPTTITCVAPARAAGLVTVAVTTPGGTGSLASAFEYWSPAQLTANSWQRAAYAGAPWSGTASAGSSGGRALSAGVAPSVGAALNGYDTADFNGTTSRLVSGVAADVLAPVAGYVVIALVFPRTVVSSGVFPNVYDWSGIVADSYGFGVGLSSSGIGVAHYDGAWKQTASPAAVSTSAWSLVRARYDGTNTAVAVNGGAWTGTTAAASRLTTGAIMTVGQANASVNNYLDGRLAELFIAASITDADVVRFRGYVATRYGVTV
jgi:hypothetical protein